jgi:hypothetical protein
MLESLWTNLAAFKAFVIIEIKYKLTINAPIKGPIREAKGDWSKNTND